MQNVYRVTNGTVSENFSKANIDAMKNLSLIQFRGTTNLLGGKVRIYHYTASFDKRPIRGT